MPPPGKPKPSAEERLRLDELDQVWSLPGSPGPIPTLAASTVRRLNKVEYRNTIRDLIGVDYDTTSEFPPDDTGSGFDNNGDVLTISPLLLEEVLCGRDDHDHRQSRADGA